MSMSDSTEALVDRLRKAGTRGTRHNYNTGDHWNLHDEAADELERLAALAQQAATPTGDPAMPVVARVVTLRAGDAFLCWPDVAADRPGIALVRKADADAAVAAARQAATPAPAEPTDEHGELDQASAIATARAALGYSAAFDGKGIDWHSPEPWPHRIELAQALGWITDLGAMVLNLADRVAAAPPATPAAQPAEEVVQRLMGLTDRFASACVQRGVAARTGGVTEVAGQNLVTIRAALESALRAALAQAVPAVPMRDQIAAAPSAPSATHPRNT